MERRKIVLLIICLSFAGCVWAESEVKKLIEQLQGKAQYFDQDGQRLGFFSPWTIRNYDEYTRIYAARLLVKKVTSANRGQIIDALLEALKNGPDDRDTGDGMVLNRSEIVFALARIDDEVVIRHLLQKLTGGKSLPMINSKAGPPEILIPRTSSNLNIITALGTFTGLEADNAATVMEMLLAAGQDPEVEKYLLSSVEMIRKGFDLPKDVYLRPAR